MRKFVTETVGVSLVTPGCLLDTTTVVKAGNNDAQDKSSKAGTIVAKVIVVLIGSIYHMAYHNSIFTVGRVPKKASKLVESRRQQEITAITTCKKVVVAVIAASYSAQRAEEVLELLVATMDQVNMVKQWERETPLNRFLFQVITKTHLGLVGSMP